MNLPALILGFYLFCGAFMATLCAILGVKNGV